MVDENFARAQTVTLERSGIACQERWVDTPIVDGRAHVLVAGEGPPVVLLSGIGLPAAIWAPLMARLDGVTQYAIDLPGYGLTDATPAFANDLRANAVRFLVEVFNGLGLDRPVVVANSLGSLLASWLAVDHPDRLTALAHIGCPAVVFDTSAPLPMRLLSVRPLGRLMLRLQRPSERQVETLAKMVKEHPLPPEIAGLILATERLDHYEHAFLSVLSRLLRLRGNRPQMALTTAQLASIDVPTLLVFANDDPMGTGRIGERMASTIKGAELHVVNGGHAPWLHHADQIAPILAAFLDRASPPVGK